MSGDDALLRLTRDLGDRDRGALGGKAVGLAALLRAGAAIPDTWVVPVGADPSAAALAGLAAVAPRWAVRSSATVEDGTGLSYAGLFRSELDVPADGLAEAIAAVRTSAHSGRVAAYRERTAGRSPAAVEMAVLLQPFRSPVRSGLWLGRGPGRGRLEWTGGSGETLVSGAVTPAWEEWTTEGRTAGSERGAWESGGQPVGRTCANLQEALGVPADLEFAQLDETLVWLQFRPMTAALGEAPDERDGRRADRRAGRCADRRADPGADEGEQVVHGIAASGGLATARGLRLRDVDDPCWEPGAVLLTDRTDPDWVPLMAEAAALVTATGGMLCHAAIVARELGVPCVTGVGEAALARLGSGRPLAVDGSAGTVAVL
ncbi:PEP-utilizing enzyme [Streptomyces tauricus]|uniref:Phosphoenolpyruvate synthase n=1 Tax=Streptomyces tauricus TaxID=68274 RepID=A0ABZ1J7D8_9ACTN|nr:PEP-utilizing enzyme [Streptomyces tauricus]